MAPRPSVTGRLIDAARQSPAASGLPAASELPGRVVVIGYGNGLRGDDAVGREVVEALWLQRDRLSLLRTADFLIATQLTPEMAEEVASAAYAVFVDAALDGHPAGSVTVRFLQPAATPGMGTTCFSDLTPEGLLYMALELYGRAPDAALVTVSVANCAAGTDLSPLVRASVPIAVASAQMAIARHSLGHHTR
ncbi:MAG TPA: hydrogenase maturation protease [Acidimicrobiales bacterium]|nr:hydrogenase maturation protease [Acidimicrobiales bacterium]